MNVTIGHQYIDGEILLQLYYKILNALQSKSPLKLELSDVLGILNFPEAVVKDINEKREDLIFSQKEFFPMKIAVKVTNLGEKVVHDLPGTSLVGIIIQEKFYCKMTLEKLHQVVTISDIKGLYIDTPGPFNMDVEKITIKARSKQIVLSV